MDKLLSRLHRNFNSTRLVALSFGAIILIGTLLLLLPVASATGRSHGLMTALFTATSATCVTGLSLFDTYTQWSGFGQVVIICLIEVGGLGFMSVASLMLFFLKKRIGLKERLVMAQALSVSDMEGVVRLQKLVLQGSLSVEAIGTLILTLRFWPEYGFSQALKWGVFHAVSAFCNAGFDIFGSITPGASLMEFNSDPVVILTLSALVVVGGLGFFVWEEVARKRKFKEFSVYTKLVLIATASLLIGGTGLFLLVEWNNPDTLGAMSFGDKLLNALFQAVTLRTAGFASIDQGALTEAGKGISMVLMLIGGSSGSTAGGLKTVTMVVLFLFLSTRIRGRSAVTVFKRTIPEGQVMDAMTLATVMVVLAVFGGIFISMTSPVSFTDALFEAISGLSTTGVTAGATGCLSIPAQYLIMIYMYFGRVGILTISLGFLMGNRAEERLRYAQTNLLIG